MRTMITKAKHRIWVLCLSGVMAALVAPGPAADAEPVDDARLLAAGEDGANWLTYGRDYSNRHFSPLDQIDRDTVAALDQAWRFNTGVKGSFQTQPLVADGMMVITTPHNHVMALDARTGAMLWRYDHVKRMEKTRSGPTNRGPALGYGKVYQATNDGRLIALDRASGALVWDSLLARPAPGELEAIAHLGADAQRAFAESVNAFPAKMPPLVAKGKVIAGVISAGYGIYQDLADDMGFGGEASLDTKLGRRGYLAAFDAETGEELWRWHVTKADGWEGDFVGETEDGARIERDIEAEKAALDRYPNAWRQGGGSTWMTPAYDPELNLIFVGTGNPSPADIDSMRPGDNLHTSSLVALDIDSGEIRWHYQIVPHDLWGYDIGNPPILFEVPSGYNARPAVGVAAKTGWFYAFNRETGSLLFKSEPFVPQSGMFRRGTPEGITFVPGSFGGASWSPSAHHPGLGLVYVAAIHKPAKLFEKTITDQTTGQPVTFMLTDYDDDGAQWGTLTALSTRTQGSLKWQIKTETPLVGGVLATAGNLVFTGLGDTHLGALDAETGEALWRFDCRAGVNAPPISYAIDGRQYIAVAAGGNRFFETPPGDAVWAFALPK